MLEGQVIQLRVVGEVATTSDEVGCPKATDEMVNDRCAPSDIDKVMINLKTEEFVLDGPPLQSLQQLIQWVGDFVLYLLANLPNQVNVNV